MHNRKTFIVYPPEYDPTPGSGHRYKKFKSLGKAKKSAMKMGKGAMIMVDICGYEKERTHWKSSSLNYVCEVV
jgi:hypothetical protein